MLERPHIEDHTIKTCLRTEYHLSVQELAFLPVGADQNTAVFRARSGSGEDYFVKLRRADFAEIAVTLPNYLHERGNPHILAPLQTQNGRLWTQVGAYKLLLYPFIQGKDGIEAGLSAEQWVAFGAALKDVHLAKPPATLLECIPVEDFAPGWRERVQQFLSLVEGSGFSNPLAADTAALIRTHKAVISDMVRQADRFAQILTARPPGFVVCHSDIHEGNILLTGDGMLYLVDWDNPILAPKERDLMFIGGGVCGRWNQPRQESLFYQGYGTDDKIDRDALAYYRFERILVDIAIYCEELLLSDDSGEDRRQSYVYLKSNFDPNQTVEIAYRTIG